MTGAHRMSDSKSGQAQATRRHLEKIGRRLFAQRGFAGVSAEEIVAAAHVTRGALYHHYSGKDGLFEAVVDTVMGEVHARLAASAESARDPMEALRKGIAVFLSVCTEPATQRILLIDAPAVLGWTKWREMDAKYGFGLLKQAIGGAMKARLIDKQDVDLLAHILLGALTEAAMLVARSSDQAAVRSQAEHALASMLQGWRRIDA
ncbi:MAG: TetR/AcrR family transcriptional regulator [Hyphomicrobiales bacterium]|nr:MAG: TetR/AcrR family transcriptional regulator [Hyphomicrobiales bacterium]